MLNYIQHNWYTPLYEVNQAKVSLVNFRQRLQAALELTLNWLLLNNHVQKSKSSKFLFNVYAGHFWKQSVTALMQILCRLNQVQTWWIPKSCCETSIGKKKGEKILIVIFWFQVQFLKSLQHWVFLGSHPSKY